MHISRLARFLPLVGECLDRRQALQAFGDILHTFAPAHAPTRGAGAQTGERFCPSTDCSRRQSAVSAIKLPLGRSQVAQMIRIALTDAAYDVIASTLPKGAARWPMQRDRGQSFIQVEAFVVDRMRAMRRPGESYSEVILRLVELDAAGLK
jgi:hypothetical protein